MIKSKTILEVVKDKRIYELVISPDSPIGEIYDALNEMRVFVIKKIEEENKIQEQADAKAQAKSSEEEKKEEVPELEVV